MLVLKTAHRSAHRLIHAADAAQLPRLHRSNGYCWVAQVSMTALLAFATAVHAQDARLAASGASAPAPAELPPVTVTQTAKPQTKAKAKPHAGSQNGPAQAGAPAGLPGPAREGTVESGYRNSTGVAGPLGRMPLQDTPYSLNVTSGELIENRDAHTEGDALMTNPSVSVSVAPNAPSASLSRVYIRGFNASDQDELRDGLVDRSFTIPPIENVQRIEVLNGLSGFLYGFTNPGGTINYVTKQPTPEQRTVISSGVYGGGIAFMQADINTPLDEAKRWLLRVNLYDEDGSTYVQGSNQKRDLVSGVLSYQAAPGTVVKVDFSHQDYDLHGQEVSFTPYTSGGRVIVPNAFDASKQYGQNWTYTKSEKDLIGTSIDSQLSDMFTLRAAYRYGNMWREYAQITDAFTATPGTYNERYILSPRQTEVTDSGYALIDAKFATFDFANKLTFGYTGTQFTYRRGLDNDGTGPTTGYVLGLSTVGDPAHFAVPSQIVVNPNADVTTQWQNQNNYVIGDNIVFDKHWSVIAGAAYSENIVRTWGVTGNYTLAASNTSDAALTPGVSLLFKPIPSVTTYVTYMQGLAAGVAAPTTSSGLTIVNANQVLPASISDQWETGVKTTLGRVDISAALFYINKINAVAEPLSATTAVYAYDGREIHEGLEVTGTGKVTDELTFTGGFVAMRATVEDSPQYDGKIPVNVPEVQARGYFEYTPWMPNLIFSFGANYDGRRPVDSANTGFIAGSVRYDTGVRYITEELGPKITTSLNVYNLLDEHYWLNSTSGNLFLGESRTVALTVRVGF